MRFENIELVDVDIDLSSGDCGGSYCVPATDELIEITNIIRSRQGNTDLVGVDYDNDVYYTHYLIFNADKKEVTLQAEVAHGEKDDYVGYAIDLLPEEKEMLLWKVIRKLLIELENF